MRRIALAATRNRLVLGLRLLSTTERVQSGHVEYRRVVGNGCDGDRGVQLDIEKRY